MTRREIFLKADPHIVNDLYCHRFTYPYKIEHAFNICKGLKFFAQGERYDEPKEIAIAKIIDSGDRFKFTPKQVHNILTSFKSFLETAIDVLGFNNAPNPDLSVNEWLDQTVHDRSHDVNRHAVNIISELIEKQNKRFQA